MQMTCNKYTWFITHRIFYFSLIALSLSAISCDRNNTGYIEEGEVTWPEITQFDDIAFRADGLLRVKDLDAARAMHDELLNAGLALDPSNIPANVANPQQVDFILGDLVSLVNGISKAGPNDPAYETLILGLHPLIAKLIEAAGMPHIHANEGPNSGFLHPVFDKEGMQVGTMEIKLHDDAGDLEVWLKKGGYDGDPWRLPLDSILTLNFPALERTVSLAVRDRERNQDESGTSTIYEGKTDYFVFPGETNSDASWLMGPDFAAKVELSFEDKTTSLFVLRPHIHRKIDE